MPDHWRERIAFWVSLSSLVVGVSVILGAVTGKVGVAVVGPPERIDSLVATAHAMFTADSVRHAAMDSVNATQDRRITTLELKGDQMLALLCVNTKPRDLALTRIPCGQYVGRWKVTP